MNRVKQTIAAFLAALTLIASISMFAVANSPVTMYGDVNLDNIVDSADASTIMQYCSKSLELSDTALANADVNLSSDVTPADATIIIQYVVGNLDRLPVGSDEAHGNMVFENISFPHDNIRLSYNKSYALDAVITSSDPITDVRIVITDIVSDTREIEASVSFSASDNVYEYHTGESYPVIDKLVRFARLSVGKKNIRLYCSNTTANNVLLFSGNFRIGFPMSELDGYVYNTDEDTDYENASLVFDYLNSLDLTTDSGKLMSYAIDHLGTRYSDMDCSTLTRRVYSDALSIDIPYTAAEQARYCADNDVLIDFSSLETGDLVFWKNKTCNCGRYHEIHHSGLYLGYISGVHFMLESSSGMGRVIIRPLWGENGSTWQLDCFGRPALAK